MRAAAVRIAVAVTLLSYGAGARADEREAPRPRAWSTFVDARVRAERVVHVPARNDLERVRFRSRIGLRWSPGAAWDLAVGARVAIGSDDNGDNARNLDNERSDGVDLDVARVVWAGAAGHRLTLGKGGLPLVLGPMLWDDDLRPAGAAYRHRGDVRSFDVVTFSSGVFAVEHPLGGGGRLAAAQVDWSVREGAPAGGALTLSYLVFRDLEDWPSQGLARTNAVAEGRLVSEFDLVDLQVVGRTRLGSWPLRAVIDAVRNFGADRGRVGVEARLVGGTTAAPSRWEFGVVARRIGREAVLAGVNSDDWWFRSASRGERAWVARGLGHRIRVRLSATRERRDNLDTRLDRVLLDLTFN